MKNCPLSIINYQLIIIAAMLLLSCSGELPLVEFMPAASERGSSSSADGSSSSAYRTVVMAGRTWTAENLNHAAGSGISRCYGENPDNCAVYGMLYDWNAAVNACPQGWSLPSKEEWGAAGDNFADVLGGWGEPERGTAGEYAYLNIGQTGKWWSKTDITQTAAYHVWLENGGSVEIHGVEKTSLFSVRCVKE
jgi:hypothetical protein